MNQSKLVLGLTVALASLGAMGAATAYDQVRSDIEQARCEFEAMKTGSLMMQKLPPFWRTHLKVAPKSIQRQSQPLAKPTLSGSSGDYLDEQLNGGVTRWSPDRFPLRVFIESGGSNFRDSYAQMCMDAMNEWSRVSRGVVRWSLVQDSAQADIHVCWMPNSPDGVVESGQTRSKYGIGADGRRAISHVEIIMLSVVKGASVSDVEMKRACLHELGHALGLVHTPNPRDIMYWQSDPSQPANLSARDGNTVYRLYTGQ